ncbi:MAG: hypothetical protein ABH873_04120, partial [Candidatus Firestonebacteria bacterium]
LSGIDQENLIHFLSALGCTILIDQVMFTYFKNDYLEFQKMTLYPKMKVGWINANPWMVFHQNVRLKRSLYRGQVIKEFTEFSKFFVQDLKEFFNQNVFETANWSAVEKAILNDCGGEEYGEIFRCELLNQKNL